MKYCRFVEGVVEPGSVRDDQPYRIVTETLYGIPQQIRIPDPDYVPIVIPERESDAQQLSYTFENGVVVCEWIGSPDPLEREATNTEVKERHLQLEQAPIEVFGVILDCDERSELRMRDAIATWDERPEQPGMFETLNGETVIYWTLGNNQVIPINKQTLQSFYNEMVRQRAIRGANLYRRYRQIKSDGCTIRELMDDGFWS